MTLSAVIRSIVTRAGGGARSLPFYAFRAAASHRFTCSARILDAPPERLLRSRLTAHLIYPSSGTKASTWNGFMAMGMFSPGEGT